MVVRSVEEWCGGGVVWRSGGVRGVVMWRSDVEEWCCYEVVLLRSGAVDEWCGGAVVRSGAVEKRYCGGVVWMSGAVKKWWC